jgi:hypothetical protein
VRHEDLLVIVWTAISTMPGGPHPVTELSPTSPPSTASRLMKSSVSASWSPSIMAEPPDFGTLRVRNCGPEGAGDCGEWPRSA